MTELKEAQRIAAELRAMYQVQRANDFCNTIGGKADIDSPRSHQLLCGAAAKHDHQLMVAIKAPAVSSSWLTVEATTQPPRSS
jgi:hypothetical protein